MKIKLTPVAAAVALALAAGPVGAADFYLAAKAYTKTLPDGTAVPMWGYVVDSGDGTNATCYSILSGGANSAASRAARQTCIDALPAGAAPGPRLVVPPGDSQVRIFLSNGLGEPTSVVIPGQEMPWSATNNGPTWNNNAIGPRSSASQRVRSFGREAPADGGRMAYVWNNNRSTTFHGDGTFLYHSGTHPQKQVYMGLAGLLTRDSAAGEAYPGVSYDNEVELFYSDLDPAFNEAVVAGTLATAVDRHPTWFLVNGEPYQPGITADIAAGAAGSNTLLRMVSTAMDTHVAVLQGMSMTIHAEDGQPYTYQDGSGAHPAPRTQYSTMLPPAKTKDAVVTAPAAGRFAVYDGNGYLTNPSDPAVETVGDNAGGMIRFLAFGAAGNNAPVADPVTVSTVLDTAVSVTLSGSDADGDPLTFAVQTGPANGVLSGTAPNLTYTPNTGYSGPDGFTYVANDGTVDSAPATVSVTVLAANTAPVADAQSVVTDEDTALAVTLTGSDADGDTLSFAVQSGPANGTLSGTAPNLTYTPNANFNGADSFTFVANDGAVDSAPATVDVTVNPVNDAPVADAQSVVTDEDTALAVTLTGSDIDSAGPLAFSVQAGPANGTLSGTAPNLTYTPNANFNGTDSFTFVANDGTLDSAAATVSVTVNPVNDAPVANTQSVTTDQGVASPVTLTGSDVDGDTLSYAVATVPANGTLSGTAPNLVYTPNAGFNGADSFTFTVNDGTVDSAAATVDITVNAVGAQTATIVFSTSGAGAVPGVAGPYDDADLYAVDVYSDETANLYSRLYDAVSDLGLPGNANVDGLSIDGATVYLSFARATTSVPGLGNVPDEDVVSYNGTAWSTYFDGSQCGLDSSNGQDIDALSVSGGVLYFSTAGGGNANAVAGVSGPYDDADIYTWNGTSCGRALDGSAAGLPGNADIDALSVAGSTYYISFRADTTVPGLGAVPDQAVVSYDGATWTLVFSGTGQLDGSNSQNVDAIQVQ